MKRLATVLSAIGLAVVASAQSTIVIPNGTATTEGNSSNAFPWGRGGTGLIIATLYDSSNFTNQGIASPIIISRLRWRVDAGTSRTWVNSSYSTATVNLSTCPVDQGSAVSASPMTNYQGADMVTCYTGPVSWLAGSTTAPGPAATWSIDLPLTTPFLYDPSLGDLNIETDLPVQTFTGTTVQLDVQTTGSNSSRIYISTGYPSGATVATLNHGVVCELTYTPASGLHAGFSADVTSGISPLTVNFTDQTYTSDPGGITSWAWDFDGDNVVDSTLQNPTFVYTNCGTYNVSLTVTDASHAPSTLLRTAYIQTDRVTANFTSQLIGPMLVQFTDTTSPAATSWAWDLDGDNIVDSTQQNPAWVYANTNPVNVTLTATRLCAPASSVTKVVVPAQQISHNVAPNNGLSTGASVYFDANVLNPLGVAISSMDVFGSVVNVPFTVDMYVKPGSHVGFEGIAAEWALVGTATGTSASATTLPSNALFPQTIYLPAGQFGIKLLYNGTGPRYMNVTGPSTVANGDLSLTLGVSRGTTVALPWSGSNIANRAWSGTFYYGTQNITGAASYGTFGPGCAGSMGVSKLTANMPQLGSTLNVTVNNMPFNAGFMMLGFSNANSIFGPLPFDTSLYGAPGCFGRVSTEVSVLILGAGNSAIWSFVIPNDPGFQGMQMYNQAIVLDTGFNALGAVLSDAAAMLIGQ
jgi:PKD repeat protein